MFRESWGHGPGAGGRGRTRGVPGVLWTGRARLLLDSQVQPVWRSREEEGVAGVGWGETDGAGVRVRGGTR